jgi:cation transport regulator ChaC
LVRLDRILALLASEHVGERASAAAAASAFIKKHKLTWWDILEGRALPQKAAAAVRRSDLGIDYLKAAESRLRQMQAHNHALEKQIKRLKTKLEASEQAE